MTELVKNKTFWMLLAACCLSVLLFLDFDYNTKGEPRESLVSYSMLHSGNWILPRNSVGEIAYKPPMLHWCIAAVSAVAGEVTEQTSRIPSALAFIALTLVTYLFFRRRCDEKTALLTALLTFTGYELHRMGYNCRVDMLLTFFIVAALYGLYRWHEKGMKSLPLTAILMMSLGTLTKGPIGALLPCLITGVYLLLQKVNFWKALLWMMAIGLLSLLLPFLWYLAAYRQSGDEFIRLMMEENVGRMTNTMSYKVHVEPWYINFLYVLMGMAPWTLLGLIALIAHPRQLALTSPGNWRSWPRRVGRWVTSLSPITLHSAIVVVVTLVFFSIPECKRSVYLMPIYPFLSYLTVKWLLVLADRKSPAIDIYGTILAVFGLLAALVFIALRFIPIPQDLFHGRKAYDNWEMLHNVATYNGVLPWLIILLLLSAFFVWWRWRKGTHGLRDHLTAVTILTFVFYLAFDGVFKPAILNAKSVKHIAQQIDTRVGDSPLYEYIESGVQAKGDPIHYYELNFYLHDRIDNFHLRQPANGYLLIGDEDAQLRLPDFQKQGYHFERVYDSGPEPLLKQTLHLYRFWR